MARMKDRQMSPPYGWKWTESQTGWEAPPDSSFDVVVAKLIEHRRANKWITEQHGLPTDYDSVADQLDAYNAERMLKSGWNHFLSDAGPSSPQWLPQRLKRNSAGAVANLKKTAAGVKLVAEWIGSGMRPVDQATADKRAQVCSVCPLNQEGGFWEKLSAEGAEEVKTLLKIKSDMTLKTQFDDLLKSCTGCMCWNQLKVWTPLNHIVNNMSMDVEKALDKNCWVLAEKYQSK